VRPVREITAEEENFRIERNGPFNMIRRDPVEPEPVGTIVLQAFRITEYRRDCDGSLMAMFEAIDKDGNETGATYGPCGLYPDCDLVVTLDEFRAMFGQGGGA